MESLYVVFILLFILVVWIIIEAYRYKKFINENYNSLKSEEAKERLESH